MYKEHLLQEILFWVSLIPLRILKYLSWFKCNAKYSLIQREIVNVQNEIIASNTYDILNVTLIVKVNEIITHPYVTATIIYSINK